jgi:DNA-binding Lrp family transcriptional regulator
MTTPTTKSGLSSEGTPCALSPRSGAREAPLSSSVVQPPRARGPLDNLDKAIVQALQHDGRATWAAIAEQCDASGPTVARRAQALVNDGIVKIAAIPGRGLNGPVESLLLSINCQAGRQLEVAAGLAAHSDIRYVALVTGEADILGELIVPQANGGLAAAILNLQSNPLVARVRADVIVHEEKTPYLWGAPTGQGRSLSREVDGSVRFDLDRIDRALIAMLQQDGRASFSHMAKVLGLDASSLRRRFDRLRALGCFTIVTVIEAAALGLESETFITIRAEPRRLSSISDALAEHHEVRYLAVTLGSSALICEVIAPSTEALYKFLTGTLADLPGVLGWDAFLETLTLKRSYVETPWWRAKTIYHEILHNADLPMLNQGFGQS